MNILFFFTLACTNGKESPTETGDSSITLSRDIQPIFDRNCIYCHGGPQPSEGISLESGAAHSALVGVTSTQVPSMQLVQPGDVEASYLWYKLNASQNEVGGSGTRMPPELMLAANELALFQAWIEAGAPE